MKVKKIWGVFKRLLKFILSIPFRIFLSHRINYKFQNSTLSKWNKSGKCIPCPYCGSEDTREFRSIGINEAFSLFDKNKKSLSLYYGDWIPNYIWNNFSILRSIYLDNTANVLKGKLNVAYLKCKSCDLIFQNYPHEEQCINEHYRKYYRRRYGSIFGRADSLNSYHLKWKELIASHFLQMTKLSPYSKVLDIGCAEGCFCNALSKYKIEGYGIDPSEAMINYAVKILKLKSVKCEVYNKDSYKTELFDAIHCFHVLEHVLDINSMLTSMSLHIKPNGILALSSPCIDLIRNEQDLNLTLGFDHIYNFTERWFRLNLPKYNFDAFEVFHSHFDLNYFGSSNPGREFNVSPWGDPPGGIYIFARKIKNGA